MHALRCLSFLLTLVILVSCADDDGKRRIETERNVKKQEQVFSNINQAWQFNTQPQNPTAASLASTWTEYRELLAELSQKPQSSIGAFRKKAKTLSQKVKAMRDKIPPAYDKPEVKSRIAVVATRINGLNLFLNQDAIDDKKVIELIGDTNATLGSLQMQFGEITRKSAIPKEAGEADMIRMLDTSRAIPNTPKVEAAPVPSAMRRQQIQK